MNYIISQEVLNVRYDDEGNITCIMGIGNTTKTMSAFHHESGDRITLKLGTTVGYTLEYNDGRTALILDKLHNDEAFEVVVDEADLPIVDAIKRFRLDPILDQVNQLC